MEVIQQDTHLTHVVLGATEAEDVVQATMEITPHLFQMFSSGLYSNQRLAVVREVLCNGWDIHIENRVGTPLRVIFDSESNTLQFMDSGCGLSFEDMKKYYITYNASSKRDNPNTTGGFGIGCKSPFAYADSFGVDSYHNGTKTVYQLTKRGDDGSYIPTLQRVVEVPTDRTGITVTLQLRNGDWPVFEKYIRAVAFKGEIPVILEVDGVSEQLPMLGMNQDEGFIYSSKLESNQVINVRVGNVVYPVDVKTSEDAAFKEAYTNLRALSPRGQSIVLMAPGGAISMTPSREELSMVPKTVNNLTMLMRAAIDRYTRPLNTDRLMQYAGQLTNMAIQRLVLEFNRDGSFDETLRHIVCPEYYFPRLRDSVTTMEDRYWIEAQEHVNIPKLFKKLCQLMGHCVPQHRGYISSICTAVLRGRGLTYTLKKINKHMKEKLLLVEPNATMFIADRWSKNYDLQNWYYEISKHRRNTFLHMTTMGALRGWAEHFMLFAKRGILTSRALGLAKQTEELGLDNCRKRFYFHMKRTSKWDAQAARIRTEFLFLDEVHYEKPVKAARVAATAETMLPNSTAVIKKNGYAPLKSCFGSSNFERPMVETSKRIKKPQYYFEVPTGNDNCVTYCDLLKKLEPALTKARITVGVCTSELQVAEAVAAGMEDFNTALHEALVSPDLHATIRYVAAEAVFSNHVILKHVPVKKLMMDIMGISQEPDPFTKEVLNVLINYSRYAIGNSTMRKAMNEVQRDVVLAKEDVAEAVERVIGSHKSDYFNSASFYQRPQEAVWLYENFLTKEIR